MKGLCVNTSSNVAQVCLINGMNEQNVAIKSPHSENLMPEIDRLLNEQDLLVTDFDTLGVAVGPGSFTGVRIGVSVIKAMSVVNKSAKLVSITSFDVISQNVKDFNYIVVLDSGNPDRLVAQYEKSKLVKMWSMQDNEINEYALNNQLNIYASKLEQEKLSGLNANFIEISNDSLSMVFQNKCAKKEYVELNSLAPVYIKPSQAERQRSEKILSLLKIEDVQDYEEIKDIENSCFGVQAWSEEIFKAELMQNYKYYFVAKYEGKNIGYVGFEQTGDDLNIQKIAVLEDYRNCGVASKLLEKVFEYRQKLDANNILLEVDVFNTVAIKFYEKFGFKTISRRENYYKNGDACFVMLKDNK